MQALHEHVAKDGFRLRGLAMSRIDGFSDVVFGFALTLIVVSLEVPHTYNELHKILLGFVPFLICFVLLFTIWWSHFKFFRRYGLHDLPTVLINCTLLFMVLFYVYPLKFLFSLVAGQLVGAVGSEPVFTSALQSRELMIVYGLGFAGIYLCFAGLYLNAWRQHEELRLSPLEKTLTLTYFWDEFGVACVGIVCCIVAWLLPPASAGAAGFSFFLIGIWKTAHGTISGRHVTRARAQEDSAAHEQSTSPIDV